jgi:putative transcriptional regulator
MKGSLNLTGHILVAQPKGPDSLFSRSVIVIAQHTVEGAWGLMVNKPTTKVSIGQVMASSKLSYSGHDEIYVGGPVETHRVHVIHSLDWACSSTMPITSEIGVTSEVSIMAAIAGGVGPKLFRTCVGHAGWAAGQLDGEYKGLPPWKPEQRWLDAPATIDSIFDLTNDAQWEKCIDIVAASKVSDWL